MSKSFLNFTVDHMTILLQPQMYNMAYFINRIILGVRPKDILYDKRKEWVKGKGEESMTFAVRVGRGEEIKEEAIMNNTIFAFVQPTEPLTQSSHVRTMLEQHSAAAHLQHVALRTNDLIAFHDHCLARGVRFVTPILRDEQEDLIQVFSGEWYFPGTKPSALFFEFVQRNPTKDLLQKIETRNRESWFRDRTFMGLYEEKEREYQRGNVTPLFDFELYEAIQAKFGKKQVFEITEDDVATVEKMMMDYAKAHPKP